MDQFEVITLIAPTSEPGAVATGLSDLSQGQVNSNSSVLSVTPLHPVVTAPGSDVKWFPDSLLSGSYPSSGAENFRAREASDRVSGKITLSSDSQARAFLPVAPVN